MQQYCPYGSVRGATGNRRSYRDESLASHRDGRGAPIARRDDGEYREYLTEEQRRERGCIARRMQPDFHHGLLVLLCHLRSSISFSSNIHFK
jgi:hypothetical protein